MGESTPRGPSPGDGSPAWAYKNYYLDSGNFTTAMVHLYRAEVTRANLWRNRLDTTTNWAVATAGAAITFLFSSPDNPHFVILLVMLAILVFLFIEARRYAYYALWYHRVRLLETGFISTMVSPPYHPPADWDDMLAQTLKLPQFPIARWRAIGIRYRRNYIWLLSLLIASWLLKLEVHPVPAANLQVFIERAEMIPSVSGLYVMGAVALIYLILGGLMVASLVAERGGRAEVRKAVERKAGERRRPLLTRPTPQERLAIIITTQREEVSRRLLNELSRGVTALTGTGMYTGDSRYVLLCALTDVQVRHLERIVSGVDPGAFVIVTQTSEIRGGSFAPFLPPE